MAIYHLEAKVITRGVGRSVVAASAYASCSQIYNDYDGVQHNYTRKKGCVYSEIFLPPTGSGKLARPRRTMERCQSRRKKQGQSPCKRIDSCLADWIVAWWMEVNFTEIHHRKLCWQGNVCRCQHTRYRRTQSSRTYFIDGAPFWWKRQMAIKNTKGIPL